MRARIEYDENGTKVMVVEAESISSQVWRGGRAQVNLINGGKVTRALQFSKYYSIDLDRTSGETP